jgi:radical SAM protein with 4Fe4S-binding SPASM domain
LSACSPLTYQEFGKNVMQACAGARVPLAGSFELTFKCNLRCVHCYIPDFSGRDEMTTAEVQRILSEAADEGCLWMLLTGGEVLSRPDFRDIYLHAKRLGLLLTVFSNGTLLDERIADLLAEYPPRGIEITLYGMSDATYLRTTGSPGRFTRVRRAVELLAERRIDLTLKAIAMEELRDEIPVMQAWAASMGIRFRYDGTIHGRLDGSLTPTAARSTPERLVQHDINDPRRRADWMTFYRDFVKPVGKSEMLMSCGAGVQSFHVDPKGTLLSCEALNLDGYDLRRGTFREGWYGIVGRVRDRRAAAHNVCAGCEIKSLCDRCPATALLETGSPDGWIPYYCEVTHRRASFLETDLGNTEAAARYMAHAEKVAGGWTPEGVILPRASALRADAAPAGGCSSGGCVSGGCGKPAAANASPQPMQIDLNRSTTMERLR